MKLVLYSDQIIPENRAVDALLLGLLATGSTIGFVPSAGDPDGRWAESRRDYYEAVGFTVVCSHDPAKDNNQSLERLLSCDAIHLSGGDTRVFQQRLSASGMVSHLREYASRGGVLIGASAGAILLTQDIATDALFHSEEPAVGSPKGLGLTKFDFFPHVQSKPEYVPALISYSANLGRPILGCPDGSGIVVSGDRIDLVGPGLVFRDGEVMDWSDSAKSPKAR